MHCVENKRKCTAVYPDQETCTSLKTCHLIDCPLLDIDIQSSCIDADNINCQIKKKHLCTVAEMRELQCCSLSLEMQLAKLMPNYKSKIHHKTHLSYSGPVRAQQAVIEYDARRQPKITYDFFYVPTT